MRVVALPGQATEIIAATHVELLDLEKALCFVYSLLDKAQDDEITLYFFPKGDDRGVRIATSTDNSIHSRPPVQCSRTVWAELILLRFINNCRGGTPYKVGQPEHARGAYSVEVSRAQ